MFKNLAFLFLFSASVQAMPKGIQGFEKKEEWAGEIEEKIEKVSNAPTKHQLQEALQTILKGPPGTEQKIESVELTEDMVNATIEKLSEAIKENNQEKEKLVEKYSRATKILEQKQKELDELGKAAQTEIDTLADQRDAANVQVEDLKIKLSQKKIRVFCSCR
ncbi:MAG: hypothetical protein BGO07_02490 [Alphaproteobacteria bacterium 40-19]|mgnify:CR=1 FL=1|nr:MAG: hypothetical protein BGO07_02490 [Alphaproteobacteria bacterium 40-19]